MSQLPVSPSQIFQLLSQKKAFEIKTLLSHNPSLNFFLISDSKGYTVLHHSSLSNQYDCLCLFLDYMVKSSEYTELGFKAWVNRESLDEGFTALHLACYKGNTNIAESLLRNGAEIDRKTLQGFTSLHIAAQADQIAAIVLLKARGCDLNAMDCKGSTALHWAAYTGCEQAINYLTRWPELTINLRDQDQGYTPLHLATITGNSKIVRRLLIKGADPSISDNKGKKAAELASENHFKNIRKMLESACKAGECYQITPVFHFRKSKLSFGTFWTIFLGVNIVLFFIDFPALLWTPWPIIHLSLFVFTFIYYMISWLRCPGYIKPLPESALLPLVLENAPGDLCPDCAIVKRSRARHCDSCGRCVEVFDHHCPWILNCVGVRNHRHFLMFLMSLWSLMIFSIVKCGYFLIDPLETGIYWADLSGIETEACHLIRIIVQCSIMILVFLFLIPTSVLMFVQIGNFLLNKTTAERFGYNARKIERNRPIEETPEKIETRNESAETVPSLVSSKGLLLGKSKRKHGFFSTYAGNCLDMCYRNERSVANEI